MLIQPSAQTALIRLGSVSDMELYLSAVEAFRRKHHGLTSAGSYERDLISAPHGARLEQAIVIFRFRSPDGSTHALFPDCLIPGSSYSVRFVLSILYAYLRRRCSVVELCDHWQVSPSTLYGWLHLFEAHYTAWARAVSSMWKLHLEMLALVYAIPSFLFAFFQEFHVPFLKAHPQPWPVPPLAPP